VFGKMQNYDQSDGGTEDEAISSSISELPTDDDYDGEEGDDEYFDDQRRNEYGGHSFSIDHINPKLTTLLNGPQWEKPDPRKRRAARVDYSEKKLAQASAKKAVKVRYIPSSDSAKRTYEGLRAAVMDFCCSMGASLWHTLTAAETRNEGGSVTIS
jgi:hypothetical protein